MIPRDLDFVQLSAKEPKLIKYLDSSTGRFEFDNHDALIELTQLLIRLDLGYIIKLKRENICPNYFNRLDYVQFIRQLLLLTPKLENFKIVGLDIGTSQSCIYPLICSKYIPQILKMYATDIVAEFIDNAVTNVEMNNLQSIIHPKLVDKDTNYFKVLDDELLDFEITSFTMCNPPFYSSLNEMSSKNGMKGSFIKKLTVGHPSELITDGGEFKFISKMLSESELVKNKITWFTTLVGKHSTVIHLIPLLKAKENSISYGIHRFKSGSFTTRWILFWTFNMECKPPIELFNYYTTNLNNKKFIKKVSFDNNLSEISIRTKVLSKLKSLPYISLHLKNTISITLPGDVFSRSYRRSLKVKNDGSVYIFEIFLESRYIIWRNGYNYKIFESFVNMINSL